MATEAQIEANRANAQKSTGPRTAEGKTVVAQNAVKHGLRAQTAVLLGESGEEYAGFHAALLEELDPEGVRETELAGRIVDLTWRLRRAGRYQDAVLEALCDQYAAEHQETGAGPDGEPPVPSDLVLGRMLLADFSGERVLERALLYERRIESSLCRAKGELEQRRGQLRLGVPRGTASGAGRGDFGGYGHASGSARGGLALETARSAGAPAGPLGQTKPTEEVLSVKCQVSSEDRRMMASPHLQTSNFALKTAAEPRSCQTNPIGGAVANLGRPGRAWDLLDQACERQPLLTGIRHPFAVVPAGERKKAGKR